MKYRFTVRCDSKAVFILFAFLSVEYSLDIAGGLFFLSAYYNIEHTKCFTVLIERTICLIYERTK